MSNGGGQGAAGWKPASNPWAIAITVTLAAFMEILDTTIVNVSLPHIAGAMSVSQDESTWTLTSYLVANSIVLPVSAFLGRIIGRKRYFLMCIAGFTLCSFLCGISGELWQLILFRLFQGFFGGGLQPSQQSIILDTFLPESRGKAFAVTAVATIVAPVLGPTLGGLITDNYSWRWIFLINVPVGIATFIAVTQLIEDPPWVKSETRKKHTIDGIGLGLIALGFGCLQIVLDRGEDADWFDSSFICAFAILAVIGLVGAVYWLLYTSKPVVDLRCLKDRSFAIGCVLIFAMAVVLYSSAVVIPQFAQNQLGYTATLAGYVLSPGALLICFIIPVVGRLMPHVQARFVVMFGFFILGVSFIYSHELTPQLDFTTLVMMRGAQTLGLAFLFVPISTLAYVTIPKDMNNDAAALFTMFRNLAGSIGISVSTALVTSRTQVRMAHLVGDLTPLSQPYNDTVDRIANAVTSYGIPTSAAKGIAVDHIYQSYLSQASVLAYTDLFAYSAVMAFLIMPLPLLLPGVKAGGGK
jgi:DHA2 family multidrug resistance protein